MKHVLQQGMLHLVWLYAFALTSPVFAEVAPRIFDGDGTHSIQDAYREETDRELLYGAFSPVTEKPLTFHPGAPMVLKPRPLLREASFPVRVLPAGFGEDALPWSALPDAMKMISPLVSDLRIGECHLSIRSGAFQLGQVHYLDGRFEYSQDAVKPRSDIYLTEQLKHLLVVSSEVLVDIEANAVKTCRKELEGRTVPLGAISLDGTALQVSHGKESVRIKSADWEESGAVSMTLIWPAGSLQPIVVDQNGSHPSLGSKLFWIDPGQKMQPFFLSVRPHWVVGAPGADVSQSRYATESSATRKSNR